MQWVLDAMTNAPAIVRNGHMDILASNPLGRALYSPVFTGNSPDPANIARFQFLDPAARDFYPSFGDAGRRTSPWHMHAHRGRPRPAQHVQLTALDRRSRRPAARSSAPCWAAGTTCACTAAGQQDSSAIPAVGELTLTYEAVDLPTDDLRGLNLTIYRQPGSVSEDQIKLLASWAATSHHPQAKPRSARAEKTT